MNMEQGISINDLRGVDIFTGLLEYDLEQIAKICTQRSYQAGERCAVQNETINELRIVKEGSVVIEMRIEVAPYTQTIHIATLRKGNVFAWSALMDPPILTASARCLERSHIICIKASELQYLFKQRSSIEREVMKNLAKVISSRLTESRKQLVRLVAEMIKQGKD